MLHTFSYKLRQNKEKVYSLFVYLILFLSSISPYSDNDWGWHYKYGEYLIKYGKILTSDIYSWTLSGYQWINHSWMYDPLLYILTNLFGLIGLSLIGALINLISFYLIVKNYKLSYWKKAILAGFFISIAESGIINGFRSQVLSSMFFAILMFILIRSKNRIKVLFLTPILFFLWANFHGDFTLGLGILGIFLSSYFVINYYQSKKINPGLLFFYIFTFISSLLATLINPFTYRVYLESFRHFNNQYLKEIIEWRPIYQDCSYCHISTFSIYVGILVFCFLYCLVKNKRFAIPFFIVAMILVLPTIDTRRLLPIFIIVTLPFLAEVLSNVKVNLSKYRIENYLVFIVVVIALQFNLYNRFNYYHIYNFSEQDYCNFSSGCSTKAISYLISHPPKGRGFNDYDVGGYFIGKNIPAKLFIDGRMHLWEYNNYSPFGDYTSIYYYNKLDKFNDYKFDWAFIRNNTFLANQLLTTSNLGSWKLEFQDDNYDYFVRIK